MSKFWGWYLGAAGLFDVVFMLSVGTWFWRRFIRNDHGTVAIEAAIVFPVLLAFMVGCVVIFQAEQQRSTAAYVAQACASAAARVLALGNMTLAQAEAQKIFDANAALWIFGASPSLGDVTSSDGVMVSCTVSSTSNPAMPLPGMGILSASVTATD
jgi:Flp pilus assembly protein TadG